MEDYEKYRIWVDRQFGYMRKWKSDLEDFAKVNSKYRYRYVNDPELTDNNEIQNALKNIDYKKKLDNFYNAITEMIAIDNYVESIIKRTHEKIKQDTPPPPDKN